MTVDDYPRFKAFWDQAARVYRSTGGEGEAKFYFGLLSEYPLKSVIEAIMNCMKVSEYIPKPSQIIEELNGGSYEDRARLAWVQVRDAIKKSGSTYSVKCKDPAVIWAIQALGGWRKFCFLEEDKTEKQFCEYYKTALRQKILPAEVPDHLAGDREINGLTFDSETDVRVIAASIRYEPVKGNGTLMLNQGESK